MMIHEITEQVGKYRARKRLGRGDASGQGGTSGRGHKGARSRAGYSRRAGYEGGQMQFFRRIPKRGFSNAPFKTHYHIVNLRSIEQHFDDGAEVTAQELAQRGVIRDAGLPLKVLGEGDLTKKFTIVAAKVSAGARAKIEGAGGSVTLVVRQPWRREAKSNSASEKSS